MGKKDINKALARKAKKDKNAYTQDSGLFYHAARGELKELKPILAHPMLDVNAQTNELGMTALHLAVQCRQPAIVNELLKHKDIVVDSRDDLFRTAFMISCELGNIVLMDIFLRDGRTSLTTSSITRHTPFSSVVASGNDRAVKFLAVANQQFKAGEGLIKYAAMLKDKEKDPVIKKHRISTCIFLAEYALDRNQAIKSIKKTLGSETEASKYLSLIQCVQEDLVEVHPDHKRAFAIASRVPLSLQVVIAYRMAGAIGSQISEQQRIAFMIGLVQLLNKSD